MIGKKMKTLKFTRYPFNLKYHQAILESRPMTRTFKPYAKELGINLVEMEVPDEETMIVFQTTEIISPDFLRSMVQIYADQFENKHVMDTGEFVSMMEELSKQ